MSDGRCRWPLEVEERIRQIVDMAPVIASDSSMAHKLALLPGREQRSG